MSPAIDTADRARPVEPPGLAGRRPRGTIARSSSPAVNNTAMPRPVPPPVPPAAADGRPDAGSATLRSPTSTRRRQVDWSNPFKTAWVKWTSIGCGSVFVAFVLILVIAAIARCGQEDDPYADRSTPTMHAERPRPPTRLPAESSAIGMGSTQRPVARSHGRKRYDVTLSNRTVQDQRRPARPATGYATTFNGQFAGTTARAQFSIQRLYGFPGRNAVGWPLRR